MTTAADLGYTQPLDLMQLRLVGARKAEKVYRRIGADAHADRFAALAADLEQRIASALVAAAQAPVDEHDEEGPR